jgi:hypothetical protein
VWLGMNKKGATVVVERRERNEGREKQRRGCKVEWCVRAKCERVCAFVC